MEMTAGAIPRRIDFSGVSPFGLFWVILGGLPLYLPVFWLMSESGISHKIPLDWYFWTNAAVSSPHVWSTYVRLQRKISDGGVSFWHGWPGYAMAVGILATAQAAGYGVHAFTAVNVWQSFHYLRQGYGVFRFYSRDPWEKQNMKTAYWAFHLTMPFLILARWDLLFTVWRGQRSEFIISVDFPSWLIQTLGVVAIMGAGLFIWHTIRRWNEERKFSVLPLIIFCTYLGIHLYGFAIESHFQRGFMTITLFHAIQYMGMVWVLEKSNRRSAIFSMLPFLLFWLLLFAWGYSIETYVITSLQQWLIPITSVLMMGISFHHYWVDGVMWRHSAGA